MDLDLSHALFHVVAWFVCVAFTIVLPSMAESRVAFLCGDRDAWHSRSLNPLTYFNLVGCVVLPAVLDILQTPFVFGYGKVRPMDVAALAHPRRDTILVALSGPLAAVSIALSAALLLGLLDQRPDLAESATATVLTDFVYLGTWMCAFNLLPLPGLPGARIATSLLPGLVGRFYARLRPYNRRIVILLAGLLPALGRWLDFPVDVVGDLVTALSDPIIASLLRLEA